MPRRLDVYTQPYAHSAIPFLLTEVITNGKGEMVDLVCRFSNTPAAALLDSAPEVLRGQRFCQFYAPGQLELLSPLSEVAFSGGSASFSYETVNGTLLRITCYQPSYGLAACILEEQAASVRGTSSTASLLALHLPGAVAVIESDSQGIRGVSCSGRLEELLQYSTRDFWNSFSADLSRLIWPEDWPGLLQALRDAAHSGQTLDREVRMLRRDGKPFQVRLLADRVSGGPTSAVFHVLVLEDDRRHRWETAAQQSAKDAHSAQRQLDQLFESLPGGSCLFRREPGSDQLRPLRVSAGLSTLLGYPAPEILRRLSSSLLWPIHADDRPDFSAALDAFLRDGDSLHQVFRMQRRGGKPMWLSFTALRQPQEDGSEIIWAFYTDVTVQHEAQETLRIRAEFNNLLLSRSNAVSVDYDPAADEARMALYSEEGQRILRTLPLYGHTPSPTVHPADWKLVSSELHSACVKPKNRVFTYRGSYDGQAFRWYQAVLVSLADSRGTVCRVLMKAEDISRRKAAESRFCQQEQRWRAQPQNAAFSVRLDLSADRLLDARSDSKPLLRLLFANTVSESVCNVGAAIPDPDAQTRFTACFAPAALLSAFWQGDAHFALEHPLTVDGQTLWLHSTAELAENPHTHHVECFYVALDMGRERLEQLTRQTLCTRAFSQLFLIDAATGLTRNANAPDGDAVHWPQLPGWSALPPLSQLTALMAEKTGLVPLSLPDGTSLLLTWLEPDQTLLAAVPSAEFREIKHKGASL